MENNSTFPIAWGVMRSGMYLTCINRYLTPDEAAYIVQTPPVASFCVCVAETDLESIDPGLSHRFVVGGDIAGFDDYAAR